jgi:hypothetical protein
MDSLYTYSYLCKQDKSILNLDLSREIDYIPSCLKCNTKMIIRYSVDPNGELWMNYSVMHE